ncbi:MAG TPA: AI-2E family transporter [Candidatus Limnocylindrales bacterium]|nr:AI-2E family transporter [Candidatus Limnocylindrales bacterium]
MDQAERKDTAQHALVYVGIAVGIVILLLLLWYAIDVALLAFIGVLLAVLLRSPADWLSSRTGWSEGWSLALVIVVLAALLATAGFFFGRAVAQQSGQLSEQLPQVLEKARERISQHELGKRMVESTETSESDTQFLTRGLRLVGSTFAALGSLVVVVFLAVFLAASPRTYVGGLLMLVAKRRRQRMREVLGEIGHVLKRWLVGQVILMAVVATLTGIGLTLLGVPFALPLALLAGLLEFVPYVGPIVAAIPALIVALSEGPQLALWVGLLYVAVQSLESYILTPLIQHRAVDLPPALILLAQVLMGVTAGPLGVIVATPLAAAALVAVKRLYVEDVLGDKPDEARPA